MATFIVETPSDVFEIEADTARNAGDFFYFYNKAPTSRTVPGGFWHKLITGEHEVEIKSTRDEHVYVVRSSLVNRIIIRTTDNVAQVSA